MDLVTDFLLLAASGAACFYCWALSKRLKGLTQTKDGFGAGIAALSQSAEEMKTALQETRNSAETAAERIEHLLSEADDKIANLQGLISQFSEMSGAVVSQAEDATKSYVDTLAPIIKEANETATSLIEAVEAGRALQGDTPPAPAPAPAKDEPAAEQATDSDDDVFELDDTAEEPSFLEQHAAGGSRAKG